MLGLAKLAPGPGNVALAERDEPHAAPGHVVLDVVATGICGTDLHIQDGEYPSVPPVTMGHEVSAVVAELGEGVPEGWRGARVVTETYFSTCGACAHCRDGRLNLCLQRRSIGTHVDGGFALRLHVPGRNLHRIPDWLDGGAATLVEPLACVCHSLLDPARIEPGEDVVVTGPGPIGLLAAQVARALGASVHVRGTPKDAVRLAMAGVLGFAVSTTDEEPLEADAVVECSGAEAGIAAALEWTRRGGTVVQIGLSGRPVRVPFDLICLHELTVTSGFASTPRSWARALELVEGRKVELEPLLSKVVPLTRWDEAFAATRAGEGIKFALDPAT